MVVLRHLEKPYWKRLYMVLEPLTQLLDSCQIIIIASVQKFVAAVRSYQKAGKQNLKICSTAEARRDGLNIMTSE